MQKYKKRSNTDGISNNIRIIDITLVKKMTPKQINKAEENKHTGYFLMQNDDNIR